MRQDLLGRPYRRSSSARRSVRTTSHARIALVASALMLAPARHAWADFEAIPLAVGQVVLQLYAVGVGVALLTTIYRFGWALLVGTVLSAIASAFSLVGLVELLFNPRLLRNGDIRGILPLTLAYLAFVWLAPAAEYGLFWAWRRTAHGRTRD